MSFTADQPPPKMNSNDGNGSAYCAAVATREHSAGFVSFRWQQPNFPPTQNVISAALSLTSA